MGYVTRVHGEFQILPDLTWSEIRKSPFGESTRPSRWMAYGFDLDLVVDEESKETDEGVLIYRSSRSLVMQEIDEYRERNLVDQIQKIIDMFPGHLFLGYLEGEGEESADIWRIVVRDGTAVRVKPEIIWPEYAQ